MVSTLKNFKQQKKRFIKRLIAAIVIIIILSLLLISRLFYLQIIKHKRYTTLSKQNAINLIPLPPRRGLIYDRNGLLVAKNIVAYSLMVLPSQVKHLKKTMDKLKIIIPITTNELHEFYKQLQQHRRFDEIPIKVKLTPAQVAIFAVNRWRFPGFSIKAQLIRYYPYGKAFAHVLGYVGRINDQDLKNINKTNYAGSNFIGKTGIEKYYEKLLHGNVGYQSVEVDASGQIKRILATTLPQAGADIYLTIDAPLQLAATKALASKQGAIVVLQPSSGQLLALVSMPSFDPNLFTNGISHKIYQQLLQDPLKPLYNRAIRGVYAAGSTIKPFFALAALDDNIITASDQIFDRGYFKLPHNNHIYHDWKRGGHGLVNVTKAIIESCDTFFYKLGDKMGINIMDNILRQFDFGKKTGIDLPNELAGVLPSPSWKMANYGHSWYAGDTINMAIGQGYLLVTPLQLAVNTAILAKRGKHYLPHLLYATFDHGKKVYYHTTMLTPVTLKHPQAWKTVLDAMHQVISKAGTAWRFGIPKNYSAAAKTGTAQVTSISFNENYKTVPKLLRPNSWIIVFAPYQHPQIAMAVLVEHDPGASAIIARHLADYFFANQKHILGKLPSND